MITQKVPLPLQDISTHGYKNYRVEAAINPRTNKKTHTPTVVKGGGGGGGVEFHYFTIFRKDFIFS